MSSTRTGLAVLGLASVMALASPALAQSGDSGFYIGAMLGQSEGSDICSSLPGATSCDEKDTAWRVIGGYQFNRYLGVEVGYTDLGESSANAGGNVTFDAAVWELVAIGSLPLGQNFAVYGKAGLYTGDTDFTAPGASGSESASDLTYGVGLQWNMTRNIALRGEWQRYESVGGTFSGTDVETDVDVLSIGALFKF